VVTEHGVSERFACRVLGQHRSTQRKIPKPRDDEAALTADIIALAIQYGRYGYRRITKMLCTAGWTVSFKRVERIWRHEGLKVPAKQPKRGRLWLDDGSCIRLRPEYSNHVWFYDFVEDRTHNGRKNAELCGLLQRRENASVIEQGCACLSPGSAIRRHKFARHTGRTSSSIRSDLDFRYTQGYFRQKTKVTGNLIYAYDFKIGKIVNEGHFSIFRRLSPYLREPCCISRYEPGYRR
jgi:hypothetical protein